MKSLIEMLNKGISRREFIKTIAGVFFFKQFAEGNFLAYALDEKSKKSEECDYLPFEVGTERVYDTQRGPRSEFRKIIGKEYFEGKECYIIDTIISGKNFKQEFLVDVYKDATNVSIYRSIEKKEEGDIIHIYNPPYTIIKYPLEIGKKWNNRLYYDGKIEYSISEVTRKEKMKFNNQVYDAFTIIETSTIEGKDDGRNITYLLFLCGIGETARISKMPFEKWSKLVEIKK